MAEQEGTKGGDALLPKWLLSADRDIGCHGDVIMPLQRRFLFPNSRRSDRSWFITLADGLCAVHSNFRQSFAYLTKNFGLVVTSK